MNAASSIMQQYGAAIALISGLYSLISAAGDTAMMGSNSGLLMTILGIVVVIHGVVLLTPYASRLGKAGGPLMIGYSLVMLLNQALVSTTRSMNWGMDGSMNSGMGSGMGSEMTAGMGWDLGMVALAVLMLISGLIMTSQDDTGAEM